LKFNRKKISGKPKGRRKEKFWSGSGKFFLLLVFIYLIYYGASQVADLAGQRNDQYRKTDIQIVGNRLVSNSKILSMCGFNSKEDNAIEINVDSLAAQLMTLRYTKGISITRRPPRLLNITVEEYEPVAFIYGRGLNLIDGDGKLIPVPQSSLLWDLPLISGIQESLGRPGKLTTAAEAYLALEIVRYLEDENPLLAGLVSEINMSEKKSIEIFLVKGGTKIRVSRESFYKELFVLKNYIANYLDWRQMAKIEYIDLRFENQLIVKPKT
jgi:cell division septal protein FtsQ